jgi:hypothetical protein
LKNDILNIPDDRANSGESTGIKICRKLVGNLDEIAARFGPSHACLQLI